MQEEMLSVSVIYGNGSMNCQGGQLLESMESVKTNFSDEMTALKRIGREPIALIGHDGF